MSKTRLCVIKYQETAHVNRVGKECTVQRISTNVTTRLFVLIIRCVRTQMVPFLVFVIQDILKLLENALVSFKQKRIIGRRKNDGLFKNITSKELKSKPYQNFYLGFVKCRFTCTLLQNVYLCLKCISHRSGRGTLDIFKFNQRSIKTFITFPIHIFILYTFM